MKLYQLKRLMLLMCSGAFLLIFHTEALASYNKDLCYQKLRAIRQMYSMGSKRQARHELATLLRSCPIAQFASTAGQWALSEHPPLADQAINFFTIAIRLSKTKYAKAQYQEQLSDARQEFNQQASKVLSSRPKSFSVGKVAGCRDCRNVPVPLKNTLSGLKGMRAIKTYKRRASDSLNVKILFNSGSARISSDSYVLLQTIVPVLQSMVQTRKDLQIAVMGHTDDQGGFEMNQKLSLDRAESVVRYLTRQGLSVRLFEKGGVAYLNPICHNSTPACRTQNRRVEVMLVNKPSPKKGTIKKRKRNHAQG